MMRVFILLLLPVFGFSQSRDKIIENFYYEGAKMFDADNYFKTIQYYNSELAPYENGSIDDSNKVATIYYLRGRCKFELKDKRGASLDFEKAIRLVPDNASFYYYMALSNHWLRNYDLALTYYETAIRINAENPQYYLNRGYARYLAGKADDACFDFSKAGELGFKEAYIIIDKYCND